MLLNIMEKKLFLKRNSSPFLAVLSAEGIVPKLVWTKRMENGDVITAQQWLDGRELKPHDMGSEQVANLLRKIHRSQDLLEMLKRLGKKTAVAANDDGTAAIHVNRMERRASCQASVCVARGEASFDSM